jgi:hypothetical protein
MNYSRLLNLIIYGGSALCVGILFVLAVVWYSNSNSNKNISNYLPNPQTETCRRIKMEQTVKPYKFITHQFSVNTAVFVYSGEHLQTCEYTNYILFTENEDKDRILQDEWRKAEKIQSTLYQMKEELELCQ